MNFQDQFSDFARISDKVYAAMETGNPAQARLVLKEHEETFAEDVKTIRGNVLKDYGISLT